LAIPASVTQSGGATICGFGCVHLLFCRNCRQRMTISLMTRRQQLTLERQRNQTANKARSKIGLQLIEQLTELARAADCGLHFGAYVPHVIHLLWLEVFSCNQLRRRLRMHKDIHDLGRHSKWPETYTMCLHVLCGTCNS